MQTPLSQTLAYAVSQLRADFVAFSSHKLEALGITQGLLYFVLYIGQSSGVYPLRSFGGAPCRQRSHHPQHPQAGRNRVRDPQGPSHRPAGQCTGTHRQWPSDHGSQPGYVCRMGRLSAGTDPRRPVPSAPGTAPDPAAPPPVQSRLTRTVPMALLPSGAGCPNDQTRIALMMRQYVPFFVVS